MVKITLINACLVVLFGSAMKTCNTTSCTQNYNLFSCEEMDEEHFVYDFYSWRKKYVAYHTVKTVQINNSKLSLGYLFNELNSLEAREKRLTVSYSLTNLETTNVGQIESLTTLNLTSNNLNNLQELKSIFNSVLVELYLTGNNFPRVEQVFPKKLRELHLNNCKISSINSDSFKTNNNLQNLILSDNNLKSLNSSLKRLTSLIKLDVSNNHIVTIEETDLPANTLWYLDLRNNKLKVIDGIIVTSLYAASSVLLGGNNIKKINSAKTTWTLNLDLSKCGIKKIEPNWFEAIRPTNYLNLDDNEIVEINEFDFSSFLRFDSGIGNGTLSLNNAGINSVAPNAFNGAKYLSFLKLNRNDIKILKDYTFNQTSLTKLEISDSNVTKLERNAFQGCSISGKLDLSRNFIGESITLCTIPNATEVDFSRNSLKTLTGMSCVKTVKVLNLTINSLENIEGTALQGLINLQTLDLTDNYLTTINPNTFSPLNELRFLNLSNNFIVNVTHFGAELKQLTDLNLSFNNMTSLELNAFNQIKNLKVLKLHGNYFTSINPLVFFNTIKLNRLTLTINGPLKMRQFPRLAFLEELEFYNSNISAIEAYSMMGLLRVQNLKFLNDSRVSNTESNALSGLINLINSDFKIIFKNVNALQEGLFNGLASLIELNLSSLNINSIFNKAFKGLDHLQVLNLTKNQINLVEPNAFVNLKSLETLDLSYNKIKVFNTGVFTGLSNLKTLNISNNQLLELHFDVIFPLKTVNFLNMDYNNISEINYFEFVHFLKKLKNIRINYNRWACADLSLMLSNFTKNAVNYKDSPDVYTDYGDNVDGIYCINICNYVHCI